jgi:hypothetical protein
MASHSRSSINQGELVISQIKISRVVQMIVMSCHAQQRSNIGHASKQASIDEVSVTCVTSESARDSLRSRLGRLPLRLLLGDRSIPHGEIVLVTTIYGIRVSSCTACRVCCRCSRLRSWSAAHSVAVR